ncbi:hypothetical protein K431DRAFT_213753 [Polychaeton citri CBS 116435]|uniref:Uncharacterized protein n=1 Tax=Polychaeton citri CBS 116435 TaxID=1314669 RepID=A0A9P4UUU6_9PEZI|nr:hypothetical protein K431DRAFT_213753 [Polychaeton citri CBS 116435]
MTGRAASTASKGSTDSASSGLDAWSKRRLNRLNTEQGFREQRQGGPSILSPPPASEPVGFSNALGVQYTSDAQPHPSSQQSQPQNPSYPGPLRTGQQPAAPSLQTYPVTNSRSGSISVGQELSSSTQPLQNYSPPDSSTIRNNLQDPSRPQQVRTQSNAGVDDASMSASKNGNPAAPQPLRTGNRQSVHNGMAPRDGSALAPAAVSGQQQQQQGVSSFSTSVIPPAAQGGPYKGDANAQGDARKTTPQPQTGDDMTEEDVNQLIKDHKELREKYTKVKKYYFEKEDQVKQLQNSLAHQRLSQSRTSLDDTEYSTRFSRLDGLIAQLAFSIRKSWKSLPSWLVASVNKDAVQIGKQEMTAAGKAFVSCWLSEEVFDKFFHPDLDLQLSQQLKLVQKNIRRFSPPCQTTEEDDFLTAKVVNWRLSTLEGLAEVLRSPQCSSNRAQLTDMLKEHLIGALSVHLQDPPTSDLEGGVHMIIELVVSIASHLPVESREVAIEYYMPGAGFVHDHMKSETGIPPLTVSIADDAADRASMKSSTSDIADLASESNSNDHSHPPGKKRSMLSALTGTGKVKGVSSAAKAAGAGGSSSSLNRPESQSGPKEDRLPSVRMAAGLGVTIRGRTVLVKAPVFMMQ